MRSEEDVRKMHDGLQAEVRDTFPFAFTDHAHLNAGSPERAYYHYGYLAALADVLKDAPVAQEVESQCN
jgi:hypothetical protein